MKAKAKSLLINLHSVPLNLPSEVYLAISYLVSDPGSGVALFLCCIAESRHKGWKVLGRGRILQSKINTEEQRSKAYPCIQPIIAFSDQYFVQPVRSICVLNWQTFSWRENCGVSSSLPCAQDKYMILTVIIYELTCMWARPTALLI